MSVIGIDLGGTKLALALFTEDGEILARESNPLAGRSGAEVGALLRTRLQALLDSPATAGDPVRATGVAVPGIYHAATGRVWAPNIPGWSDYPLLDEVREAVGDRLRVGMDSDRAACILGEVWRGSARGSRNAVFIAVGTGIGAGILVDGEVLRGARDIAGAIGWMALDRPRRPEFEGYGCFEYQASGPGLVRYAHDLLARQGSRRSAAAGVDLSTTEGIFAAYAAADPVATEVVENAVQLWGMAAANLVSLFDPEVVIFGGGVFGPANALLGRIRDEALRWGQPISTPQVPFEVSALGGDAGLYGAGQLALRTLTTEA